MKRRDFLKATGGMMAMTGAGPFPALAALNSPQDGGKPLNVLFIITDDQNCALGCYGHPYVKTPNLDRLSTMGVRFDRAYCNYPLCSPSRTSVLSGLRPDSTGVYDNNVQPDYKLGKDFKFLPEHFHDHGYFTAGVGKVAHWPDSLKWDAYGKVTIGGTFEKIDKNEGVPAKMMGKGKNGDKLPFYWQITDWDDDQEPDGMAARNISEVLEQHKDGPFFIACGFHKPHVPFVAPKKYFDLYPVDEVTLPIAPTGHEEGIPPIANPPECRPTLPDQERKEIIAYYYAASAFMDAQAGVLIDTMDRLKLWDNTVVVYMADHGWHLGEHNGWWAKLSLMEEAVRVPTFIIAPGKQTKAVCSRVTESVDIYPTLCDLCGIPKPDYLEGTSLVPLLDNPQDPSWKKAAFAVVTRGPDTDKKLTDIVYGHSVRTERYTYILWPDGSEQFYDSDPKEHHNLAGDPAYAGPQAAMKQLLQAGWKSAVPATV